MDDDEDFSFVLDDAPDVLEEDQRDEDECTVWARTT